MKKKLFTTLLLLITVSILSACGEQEPTEDAAAVVLTQAALTANAGLTQAALNATSTNTPLPPSPTATITETPTQFVIATNEASPTGSTTSSAFPSSTPFNSGTIPTATQQTFATATSSILLPPTATLTSNNTGSNCYRARYEGEPDPMTMKK